jgi:hypothetical protein
MQSGDGMAIIYKFAPGWDGDNHQELEQLRTRWAGTI